MSFEWRNINGLDVLSYGPWLQAGIEHGFVGTTGDFGNSHLPAHAERLCLGIGVQKLCVLSQVHGKEVLSVKTRDMASLMNEDSLYWKNIGSADAFLIERGKLDAPTSPLVVQRCGMAFGIRTADCLSIVIKGETRIGLLHAGWRGLAAGVIQSAITAMLKVQEVSQLEVLIGPAAGQCCYEVGSEVVSALGAFAVARASSQEGHYFLSLHGTAIQVMMGLGLSENQIHCVSNCTIEDKRFHSYRRYGGLKGSNLSYVGPCSR